MKNMEKETSREFIQDNESNFSTKETKIITTGTASGGKATIGRKTKEKQRETSVFNRLCN